MLDVCLLGTGGTLPLPGRRLSSVLVRAGRSLILLDCGEGTQVALREKGWGLRRLEAICITHAHADHVLGLPGLLLTLAFTGKGPEEPLTVYGPEPVRAALEGLLVVAPRLPYPLRVVALEGGEMVPIGGETGLELTCATAQHDVPCLAYSLHLPRAPRFDVERARRLGVPVPLWRRLQRGEAVLLDGRTISPEQVQGEARRGLRVALVTDTCPTPALVDLIRARGEGTDLLVAEGMYGDESEKPARWTSRHLTFAEAAELARGGGARRLWLTHFGPALTDPAAFRDRATTVFPPAAVGRDGLSETLNFED